MRYPCRCDGAEWYRQYSEWSTGEQLWPPTVPLPPPDSELAPKWIAAGGVVLGPGDTDGCYGPLPAVGRCGL